MNLTGLKDLFASERGVFAIAMTLCSTVLVYTGHMTTEVWTSFNELLCGLLIGGKTLTTTASILKSAPTAAATDGTAAPAAKPAGTNT